MIVLPIVRSLVVLREHRDQEKAADILGLEPAGKAGYDIHLGARAILKISDFENEKQSPLSMFYPSFLQTHPSTGQRYDDLVKICKEETLEISKQTKEKKAASYPLALAKRLHKWIR